MLENVKTQLTYIALISLFFLVSTWSIISFTDPFKSSVFVITFFYLSAAIFLVSLFTLVFYFLRFKSEDALHYQKLRIAYRESWLLTLFVIGSLILSSSGFLYWWIELVFVLALLSIEIFFLI